MNTNKSIHNWAKNTAKVMNLPTNLTRFQASSRAKTNSKTKATMTVLLSTLLRRKPITTTAQSKWPAVFSWIQWSPIKHPTSPNTPPLLTKEKNLLPNKYTRKKENRTMSVWNFWCRRKNSSNTFSNRSNTWNQKKISHSTSHPK